jgi:hypothetical protein
MIQRQALMRALYWALKYGKTSTKHNILTIKLQLSLMNVDLAVKVTFLEDFVSYG